MLDDKTRAILSRATCTVDEAAGILGISRPTVIGAIERKELVATKFGTRYVIPTAPLRRMLHVDDVPPANVAAA